MMRDFPAVLGFSSCLRWLSQAAKPYGDVRKRAEGSGWAGRVMAWDAPGEGPGAGGPGLYFHR